ncbi:hypothetical protein JCM30394_02210 [Deferrisoma palaeochoriense]
MRMIDLVGNGTAATALELRGGVPPVGSGESLYEELVEGLARVADGIRRRSRVRLGRIVGTVCRWARTGDPDGALLRKSLEPYSPEELIARHSANVTVLSLTIARAMGLDEAARVNVALAAAAHDLGMAALPEDVVLKPSAFSEGERRVIEGHPSLGFRLLRNLGPKADPAARAAFEEHEREDGSGYPRRLRGDAICLEAKIIAVADTFEAMVHPRPHRPAVPPHQAVAALAKDLRGRLAPRPVRALLRELTPFPPTTRVRLSDGRSGTVWEVRPSAPLRPVIRVWESGGARNVDLLRHPSLRIAEVLGDPRPGQPH